jgi:predicted phosphodiesterase
VDHFKGGYSLGDNAYLIPLTVRFAGEDQAVLFFELQEPGTGRLIYREVESQIQEVIPFSANNTRHLLTIDRLNPDTTYQVDVILEDENGDYLQPSFLGSSWGSIQFQTLPTERPLRIGVFGDASFGDDATQRLVELMVDHDLDFVIHTGDVVYETDSSDVFGSYVNKYFMPLSPLLHQGPIYTVLGNHDYDPAVRWEGAPFYDYVFPPFPQTEFAYPEARRANQYYALAVGDIQFLMLDTHVFAGAEGRAEQDSWMEDRLADPRFRVTIPVFHVSPYSSSIVHPNDGLPVRLSWNWKFEGANVSLVLSGHFHHYERLIANGISYLVTGGGSSTLYAQGSLLPESEIYARKTHFVLMEISDESVEITAISLDGEVIDRTSIPLN